MIKVSVVITAYNHEEFIAQAVTSVLLQQVDFPYEIIIGDDCSTDGTGRIVDNLQRAHPELIRVLRPERNLGDRGRAMFVETLKAARGKYIAMLDGDDYWLSENKLATQVAQMEADPACTMTYHNVIRVFEDGSPSAPYNDPQHAAVLTTEKMLEGNFVPGCSPVIRADLVADFPPWFFTLPCADWPLTLMATESGTVRYINKIFGAYRIHRGGVWAGLNEEAQAAELVSVFEILYPHFAGRYAKKLDESLTFYRERLAAARARAAGAADGSARQSLVEAQTRETT
jgi:glycosyltransferase involved in cell wall biosynthesis